MLSVSHLQFLMGTELLVKRQRWYEVFLSIYLFLDKNVFLMNRITKISSVNINTLIEGHDMDLMNISLIFYENYN